MVPGLLERERMNAEARRRDLLATAAREHRADEAAAQRPRRAAPDWRWSLGGLLVRAGERLQGPGWATRSAPTVGPVPGR
jgi:hypothetical protein